MSLLPVGQRGQRTFFTFDILTSMINYCKSLELLVAFCILSSYFRFFCKRVLSNISSMRRSVSSPNETH